MKKYIISVFIALYMIFWGIAFAQGPPLIRITAEQAFDAVQSQTDPETGYEARVALIDVRTRAEYFWVGAACAVVEIVTTNGDSFVPDLGKVKLSRNGWFLRFEIDGRPKWMWVKKVSFITLEQISLNIPYKLWDEETATTYLNPDFGDDVNSLASNYDVLIFFCRSGGRSEACLIDFKTDNFDALYEIDQPDGKSGRGGFEGTSYSNVYNGYRGFPKRLTVIQEHPSVSWKDTGLPMKTSMNPLLSMPE